MTTSTTTVSNSYLSNNPDIRVAQRTIGGAVFQLMGNGLVPEAYNAVYPTYTGDKITGCEYRLNGAVVATLTLGYTGDNLTSVVRS